MSTLTWNQSSVFGTCDCEYDHQSWQPGRSGSKHTQTNIYTHKFFYKYYNSRFTRRSSKGIKLTIFCRYFWLLPRAPSRNYWPSEWQMIQLQAFKTGYSWLCSAGERYFWILFNYECLLCFWIIIMYSISYTWCGGTVTSWIMDCGGQRYRG